jgi:hypothetical protein
MALDDRIGPLDLILDGKTAALFRITLALVRKKRKDSGRHLSVSAGELGALIVEAYLQRHEQDILEDMTDEVERLAAEAVVGIRRRKSVSGLPNPYRRRHTRRPAADCEVPQVPHDGGDAGAHERGGAAPNSADSGDQAAE